MTKIINPVTVALKLPPLLGKIHPVFHSSLLKPVTTVQDSPNRPGPVTEDHYEIGKILDSKMSRRRLRYLVRWKGYPYEEAPWVPANDVTAKRLLRQFHRKHPLKPQPVANISAFYVAEGPLVKGELPVEPTLPLDNDDLNAMEHNGCT